MKTSRLYNILLLFALALMPGMAQAQGGAEPEFTQPVTQDQLDGRRALVGPGCVVNQLATNVQLLSGVSGLENLVDEDLNNFATFTQGIAVGVTEQPLFSVKDMNNTYAAGTEAGICMVSSQSGGLLSLSVIQLFSIKVYNNGELVETINELESGLAGSGVALDLIKIPGSDDLAVNLTCRPTKEFDELYVFLSGGLDVSVIKELKFKYAFVGQPRQCLMTHSGVKAYGESKGIDNAQVSGNSSCTTLLFPTGTVDHENLVDDDITNSTSIVSVISIGYKGAAKVSTDPDEPLCGIKNRTPEPTVTFPAGSELGFVYTNGSALDLGLGNYVEIKVYNTDGTTQTERVEAGVLSLGVAEGGRMTSSVVADKEFYAFEIGFYAAVNVNLGTINVHYGFVNEPADAPHRCPINPSVNSEICDVQGTYQLLSNPTLAVQWELSEALDETGNDWTTQSEWTNAPGGAGVTVTPSGFVEFHDYATETEVDGETRKDSIIFNGKFTFKATSVGCKHNPKCVDYVVIDRGINSYDPGCAVPLINVSNEKKYELSDELPETSGALISISNLKEPDNILDKTESGEFDSYAEYVGGLSLASNIPIVGVKLKDENAVFQVMGQDEDGNEVVQDVPKRIGFILETESSFLNADVLQFFQIRCYKDGEEVFREVVDETNAVGVGLISGDKSQKVRYSIEVPADKEFDEFVIWTAGLLKLDLTTLRIYYAFIENGTSDCNDPLKCAEPITSDNGAMAYPDLEFSTVSAAGVVQNLSNLIDGSMDTYFLYQNTVQVGSGMTVRVKLGKTLDYRHQFGIVMDNNTFLAGVELGEWMTVATYYNGEPTGEEFTNWGVLGLDLIGYGDKRYLVNSPTRNFDEVRITFSAIANVLNGYKIYGLFIRGDKNLNGISDCMDPDQSCAEDLGLGVTAVCAGDVMKLTGKVTGVDSNYKITVIAPDQDYEEKDKVVETNEFTIDIPTKKAGTGLNIMVYGDNGRYLDGITYTVHPTRAEWRKTPINTDWNEPNNWDGNVNPYCCTDVVIPDGAERYPVLVTNEENPADTYCCNGIYFKASPDGDEDNPAQVVNVPELAYSKAWVDVRMMPNRYYMFSSPLKSVYTGDLFVPAGMNGQHTGQEFEDLGDADAQNRFNPSIYQRMWNTTPDVRLLDDFDYTNDEKREDKWADSSLETDVETGMVDWSRPFNTLNHPYTTEEGFSVWVDNGDLPEDQAVIMRLPKQNKYYNYYTPEGELLPEHEGGTGEEYPGEGNFGYSDKTNLSRPADNVRFIYENYENGYDGLDFADDENGGKDRYKAKKADSPFTDESAGEPRLIVTAYTEKASETFAVGNPFMSDIDIKTFLEKNGNIKELRRYNGDCYEFYRLGDGGELVTNMPVEEDVIGTDGEVEMYADGNVKTTTVLGEVSRKKVIHPLESFFVSTDTTSADGMLQTRAVSGINLPVYFTRSMMLEAGSAEAADRAREAGRALPMLRVTAEAGGRRAAMLVADSTVGINVETMLDAEVAPTVAVFAATGGKACDMVSTSAAEIPLGVVMAEADTLRFSFSAEGGVDLADWELVDRADGSVYGLDGPVEICGTGSNVGRFVLRSRSRMAEEMAAGGNRVYVACRGGEAVATASAGFVIERMDVYTVDGVMYGSAESADGATCAVKVPRGSVVVIRVTGDGGDVETFKMLTP